MPNYYRVFIPNSFVFFTINTYKRQFLLIDNVELLRESFKEAKQKYDFEIHASVILPDHMHLLLSPSIIEEYPKIIYKIKYHFSRNLNYTNKSLSESKSKKGEKGIWQRRYWEHTIKDESDYKNHMDYIHYNPVKHSLVKKVKDWQYSSFEKFVKKGFYDQNWGNTEEIKMINKLNFE